MFDYVRLKIERQDDFYFESIGRLKLGKCRVVFEKGIYVALKNDNYGSDGWLTKLKQGKSIRFKKSEVINLYISNLKSPNS
jgi:hypothetical protein